MGGNEVKNRVELVMNEVWLDLNNQKIMEARWLCGELALQSLCDKG